MPVKAMTPNEIQLYENLLNLLGTIDTPIGRRKLSIDPEVLEESKRLKDRLKEDYERFLRWGNKGFIRVIITFRDIEQTDITRIKDFDEYFEVDPHQNSLTEEVTIHLRDNNLQEMIQFETDLEDFPKDRISIEDHYEETDYKMLVFEMTFEEFKNNKPKPY